MKEFDGIKLSLFCIMDATGQVFEDPFPARNGGVAERMFRTLVNRPGTQYNNYPADYHLYYIGEFDQHHGLLIPAGAPVKVVSAVNVLDQPQLVTEEELKHA